MNGMSPGNASDKYAPSKRWTLKDALILLPSLVSLGYATVTAFNRGDDLFLFYRAGKDWLAGIQPAVGVAAGLYPPFAFPLFAVLASVPQSLAVPVGVLANLASTIAVILLVTRISGREWSSRAILYLSAFFVCWAPFRVTLRMGQNSLMIAVALLAALLARQKGMRVVSGIFLGLSLTKYSLTLPFFLYLVWKREWTIVGTACLLMALLTQVFALQLGISATDAVANSFNLVSAVQAGAPSAFAGNTELKLLIYDLTGQNASLTAMLTIALGLAGLVAIGIVSHRLQRDEMLHYALLALFALWSAYHRVYDSVFCIVPAVLLVHYYSSGRLVRFSRFWLCGLAILVVSIPGLLTERLGLTEAALRANPIGWLALHSERLLVFGLFCALCWVGWKSKPATVKTAA